VYGLDGMSEYMVLTGGFSSFLSNYDLSSYNAFFCIVDKKEYLYAILHVLRNIQKNKGGVYYVGKSGWGDIGAGILDIGNLDYAELKRTAKDLNKRAFVIDTMTRNYYKGLRPDTQSTMKKEADRTTRMIVSNLAYLPMIKVGYIYPGSMAVSVTGNSLGYITPMFEPHNMQVAYSSIPTMSKGYYLSRKVQEMEKLGSEVAQYSILANFSRNISLYELNFRKLCLVFKRHQIPVLVELPVYSGYYKYKVVSKSDGYDFSLMDAECAKEWITKDVRKTDYPVIESGVVSESMKEKIAATIEEQDFMSQDDFDRLAAEDAAEMAAQKKKEEEEKLKEKFAQTSVDSDL